MTQGWHGHYARHVPDDEIEEIIAPVVERYGLPVSILRMSYRNFVVLRTKIADDVLRESPLSQERLAEYTGLSRETLSRALTKAARTLNGEMNG